MTASEPASRRDAFIGGDELTELASNRTALAFARTRMSVDRTMLAVARACLSLTGFGFVIFELSPGDRQGHLLGIGMVALGLMILAVGVAAYGHLVRHHDSRRRELCAAGLLHPAAPVGAPAVLLISALLLAVGAATFVQTVIEIL